MTESSVAAPAAAPDTIATSSPADAPAIDSSEPSPEPRREKVVVDGEEMELTIDELKAGFQRAKASHKRFEDASSERKKAEEIYNKLKQDPFAAMVELGLNPREMSEAYLIEQLKAEQEAASMSEDQKKAKELEKKIAEYEKKEKEALEQAKKKQHEEMQQKFMQSYDQEFTKALDTSGLPRNPTTIRRIAEVMYTAMSKGHDMPVSEAAEIVRDDMRGGMSEFIKSLKGDKLAEWLGKDALEDLRKYELSKLKNPVTQESAPVKKPSSTKSPKSLEDFLASL